MNLHEAFYIFKWTMAFIIVVIWIIDININHITSIANYIIDGKIMLAVIVTARMIFVLWLMIKEALLIFYNLSTMLQ